MNDGPIPAATLVVMREAGADDPQYLMVERASAMAFAGGAWVFPGGRIDDSDRALARHVGPDVDPAMVAAIRETIEETAIPVGILPVPDRDLALAIHQQLIAGEDFATILAEAGLRLDPSALTPFARWVPQFHAVRRFDTMFFIAQAPPGDWTPIIDPRENRSAEWISAREILERASRSEAVLIFPTRRNLERLALHRDFASLADDAARYPVVPISPWLEERDGERFVTIPDSSGYPVTREKLEGLWRG